jgi:DNA-binding PadR family transcriptional regulator
MDDQRRLPLEQPLLGFLMQGPLHGYDLHRRAVDELGPLWYMGISHVYGALKQLERAGLVECAPGPQESRRTRRIYRITPAGRKRFRDWVQQPVPTMRRMRVEFLAKLYFFRAQSLAGGGELITAQEEVCRERAARLEQQAAQCVPGDFARLVFDFRRRQVEAILEWLAACREELGV